jgi:hypothetical protein
VDQHEPGPWHGRVGRACQCGDREKPWAVRQAPGVLSEAVAPHHPVGGPQSRRADRQGQPLPQGHPRRGRRRGRQDKHLPGRALPAAVKRIGKLKALVAVARSILVIIWSLLVTPPPATTTSVPATTPAASTPAARPAATSASSKPSGSPSPSLPPPDPKPTATARAKSRLRRRCRAPTRGPIFGSAESPACPAVQPRHPVPGPRRRLLRQSQRRPSAPRPDQTRPRPGIQRRVHPDPGPDRLPGDHLTPARPPPLTTAGS